jgi:hypothetical protein
LDLDRHTEMRAQVDDGAPHVVGWFRKHRASRRDVVARQQQPMLAMTATRPTRLATMMRSTSCEPRNARRDSSSK